MVYNVMGGVRMSEPQELYRVRDFAHKAGVSVRTLHHYDRLGVLKPAGRSPSGQRLYGRAEFERLEQIIALKFFGLSLTSIKALLAGGLPSLAQALALQRESVERMRGHLERVAAAIGHAQTMVDSSGHADWNKLKAIIEVMEMNDDMEWVKKYYSGEQLAALQSRAEKQDITAAEREWKALIAEVEAALEVDPASEKAQELAKRWSALVQAFTGGDPGIAGGLNRLYADEANWPETFTKPFSDDVAAFICKAMESKKA